jgi:hypothetical protein
LLFSRHVRSFRERDVGRLSSELQRRRERRNLSLRLRASI